MSAVHARFAIVVAAAVAGLAAVLAAPAQTGSGYKLTLAGITGGGGTSSDPRFTLTGAVGQPAPGRLVGLGYTIDSGVLAPGVDKFTRFLPFVAREP